MNQDSSVIIDKDSPEKNQLIATQEDKDFFKEFRDILTEEDIDYARKGKNKEILNDESTQIKQNFQKSAMAVINIHKEIIEEESQQETEERVFENDYMDGDEVEEDCDQQDGESQIDCEGEDNDEEEEDYELNSEEEELFQRLEEDNQFELQQEGNQTVPEEVEELEESKFDKINENDLTDIQLMEDSKLSDYAKDKSPYEDDDQQQQDQDFDDDNQQDEDDQQQDDGEEDELMEEDGGMQSLTEVNKKNDEFWAKQAERINSKMHGMMKSMVNQQSKDIFNQQQQMNCFAFYSANIKQCLSGMANANKIHIEKLFYDAKSKEEQHQTNEDPQKLKKKRNLVSNNLEQSYHIRSVVKLFDELNNYQKIYPFVKQHAQNKHIQFRNFSKSKDNVVNQLISKYCKAQTYPVRKPQKPPQYDENVQIRKQYHYKLRKRIFCLSNKKNAEYEEEPDKEKPIIISIQPTISSRPPESQRQGVAKITDNNPSPSIIQNKTIISSVLAQSGNYNKYTQQLNQKSKHFTTQQINQFPLIEVGTTSDAQNDDTFENSITNHHSPERNLILSPQQNVVHFKALHNIGHEFIMHRQSPLHDYNTQQVSLNNHQTKDLVDDYISHKAQGIKDMKVNFNNAAGFTTQYNRFQAKEFLNLNSDPLLVLQQQRLSGLRIDNKPQEDLYNLRDDLIEIAKYYTGSHLLPEANYAQRGSQKYLESNDSIKKMGTMAMKYQNQYNKFQIYDQNALRGTQRFDAGVFKQELQMSKGVLDTGKNILKFDYQSNTIGSLGAKGTVQQGSLGDKLLERVQL